jgi:dienelactone hydrolase
MSTLESGGKLLRLHTAIPAAHAEAAPGTAPAQVPAVLLLHGAGGNVLFWFDRVASALKPLGFAVFAVHYFDRTGTTRAETAELRDGVHIPQWLDAIRDTLMHLSADPRVDPARIALVGISLGAFLSLSLAAELTGSDGAGVRPFRPLPGRIQLKAVVDLSGGLIPPWRGLVTAAFPPTLIVHGDQDTVVAVNHAHGLHATLSKLQVAHVVEIFPGESHWFTPAAQARILLVVTAFLEQHLARNVQA